MKISRSTTAHAASTGILLKSIRTVHATFRPALVALADVAALTVLYEAVGTLEVAERVAAVTTLTLGTAELVNSATIGAVQRAVKRRTCALAERATIGASLETVLTVFSTCCTASTLAL